VIVLALVLGLVAGSIAWLVGETSVANVEPAKSMINTMGQIHEGVTPQAKLASNEATEVRTFGLFGVLLAVALGLAGGFSRNSMSGAVMGAVVGLVAGGAAGALATRPAHRFHDWFEKFGQGEVLDDLLQHVGLWAPLAIAAGFAFAVGLGRRNRFVPAMLGALIGAVAGTTAFELIGTVAFPLAETGQAISATPLTRFLARLLLSLATALGIGLAVVNRPRRAARIPAATGDAIS
jgi:hypothetical protein